MKKETIECPYCGEEILAIAKKCKHCGEWLDNEEVDDECVEECVEEEEDDDDNTSYYLGKAGNAVWEMVREYWLILILVPIALFTLPSKQKQEEKMMEELRVVVRKEIKKEVRNENFFTQVIGVAAMKDTATLDKIIRQRYAIKIHNYQMVSFITVKEKDTGENNICGIAAFGFVYTTPLLLGR